MGGGPGPQRRKPRPQHRTRSASRGGYSLMMVALINPNTDVAVTKRMLGTARAVAPPGMDLVGLTARYGAALITNEAELAQAAEAVESLSPELSTMDGAIIAAFGDPGLARLRALCPQPMVGIGESALREAARDGRRFAVATTTPALVDSIVRTVTRLGLLRTFSGVVLTRGDARAVTGAPDLLLAELDAAICRVEAGVDAVVIGGGPLADAASELAARWSVAVIEPVPTAVRHLARLLAGFPEPSGFHR